MNLNYSNEQNLLKESIDKFYEKNFSIEMRNSLVDKRISFSEEVWSGLAKLGVLGIPFEEKFGGYNGTGFENMLVMQAMGESLALEPYFTTVCICGNLIQHGASEWQKSVLIPGIVEGSILLSFAHAEPNDRGFSSELKTFATSKANNWVLNGKKTLVLNGSSAEKFIVSAKTDSNSNDFTLFIIESDDEKLEGYEYPLIDGSRALDLRLNDLEVGPESVLGTINRGSFLVDRVIDHANAAICAETVGIMTKLHQMTLNYLKTREQFGNILGRFQVLQHRAVEMYVKLEQAKSMSIMAAGHVNSNDSNLRKKMITAAKEFIMRVGIELSHEAIQLHGGMGMANEMPVGTYFKRLKMLDLIFGDSNFQRNIFSKIDNINVVEDFHKPSKLWKKI